MTRGRIAFLVAMVMALAACGSNKTASNTTTSTTSRSTTATSTTLLPKGSEAARDQVPWASVGPGWTLALWSPASGQASGDQPPAGQPTVSDSPETLYLVNPLGGRYSIATFPAPGESNVELADWSGDGTRALFTQSGASATGQTIITVLDLATGTPHRFTVSGNATAQFTRPSGKAILLDRGAIDTTPASLEKVDLGGAHQLTYPASFPGVGAIDGNALETLDGTQLVMSAASGMALVANGGSLVRTLDTAAAGGSCSPVRWWTASQVLASCVHNGVQRLWLVPTSGAAATALTAPPTGQDLGDMTAWQVPAGTYVEDAGPCGFVYLAKLNPDHTTSPVTLPGVDTGDKSVLLIGADGGRLALRATVACGGGVSLLWFDPGANTTDVVLGPPVNGGGVLNAVVYPPSG